MIDERVAESSVQEVFLQVSNGEFIQFDMTLPLQMLFDDVMNFVSKADFEN